MLRNECLQVSTATKLIITTARLASRRPLRDGCLLPGDFSPPKCSVHEEHSHPVAQGYLTGIPVFARLSMLSLSWTIHHTSSSPDCGSVDSVHPVLVP